MLLLVNCSCIYITKGSTSARIFLFVLLLVLVTIVFHFFLFAPSSAHAHTQDFFCICQRVTIKSIKPLTLHKINNCCNTRVPARK